jgi:hypothetical protein
MLGASDKKVQPVEANGWRVQRVLACASQRACSASSARKQFQWILLAYCVVFVRPVAA